MAKRGPTYTCQACGAVYHRWQGKCDACGTWSSLSEEAQAAPVPGARGASGGRARGRVFALEGLKGETQDAPRIVSGIGELDRVTGGGFVPGSVLLIGGDPGIGKSTLLMQACAALALSGRRVVYVSGEESTGQVRLRAERMGLSEAPVELAAETNVEDIVATLGQGSRPALVVIDSIQTMWSGEVESAPGTVTQVRGSAQALIRYAKTSGACMILVGHVTKDGQIAGPRVVEHMVDAVLSFEGEGAHSFRILRGQKNRFGATDEIGVFEMTGKGLSEVSNPSALFLAGRDQAAPGAAVFAGMEGTRPVLVEIQALVARRLGEQPPVDGAGRARDAWRAAAGAARRLSQRRRRIAGQRAGRRSRGGGRAGVLADGGDPAARIGVFRRNRAVRRGQARFRGGCAAARGLQAGFRGGADAGRRRRGRRRQRPVAAAFRSCHGTRCRYRRARTAPGCEMSLSQ